MRLSLTVALVASLLLAGCSAEGGGETPLTATVAGDEPGIPYTDTRVPLRFATPDYEGSQSDTASFTIQEQCIMLDGSCSGGERLFDLTPIIPADAPVELLVKVYGANADLEFTDAFAIGEDQEGYGEYDGEATTFAPIVVRGASGTVTLHVYNPGGFSVPPEPNPSAMYQATSVVRSDLLVPGVPATLRLQPGERLNLTSELIEDVLLIAPDGTPTRDDSAPFELVANGTAGDYTILMRGGEATSVYGPNVTMTARVLAYVEEAPHALSSGGETTWDFPVQGIPVQVGLTFKSGPSPVPFLFGSPTSFVTDFALSVAAPTGAVVVEADNDEFCGPFCGGGFQFTASSPYLHEQLRPGDYAVAVTYTGNEAVAFAHALVIV